MSDYLDQIEERAEDARRNREMYSKDSRSRRITNEESAKDVPRLLAAIRAVEAVHESIDALNVRFYRVQKVCTGCGTDDGNWQTWPCPTIRAITNALEGEQ